MPVIMPRFSHRLALKIVLPFAALTLAIGAVGNSLIEAAVLRFRHPVCTEGDLVERFCAGRDEGKRENQSNACRVGKIAPENLQHVKSVLSDLAHPTRPTARIVRRTI